MGDKQNQPFQLSFNAALKIDFQGSRVTSEGGLILVRELDERLGFRQLIEEHLRDPRRGKNTQLPLADLLRQSVDGRLAGAGLDLCGQCGSPPAPKSGSEG
jgi:predicted ribosome quality control (RQC) complex YloA/Tae2 family protein